MRKEKRRGLGQNTRENKNVSDRMRTVAMQSRMKPARVGIKDAKSLNMRIILIKVY